MIRGQKPPGKGPVGSTFKWAYLPIGNGRREVGFLAGPVCGVFTHYSGGSKPCRDRATNGKLACPYCADRWDPVWRGAVPIYDREYVRRWLWITEDYFEAVSEIPLHAQVSISREKDTHAPAVIRPDNWRLSALPVSKDRAAPVDLMPFLLRVLWKDHELFSFAAKEEEQATATATAKSEVTAPLAGALARIAEREARDRAEREREEKKIGDTFNRLTNGTSNGKHKPKTS